MFDFLKKKIGSWLKKPQKSKKERKTTKPVKSKIEKKQSKKLSSKLTENEKKSGQEVEKIMIEAETSISEQVEEQKESKEEKTEGNFFTKLIKKISSSKLTQEDFEEIFQEFEITLLENNVALEAVDKIKENLSNSLVGQQIKKTEVEARVLQALKDSILNILTDPPNVIDKIKEKKDTFTIIFFGINGTGKTTTIAKVAHLLKNNNITSVLAAADTFRAASIEQLKTHGERLNIPVIHQEYGSDPAAVAFDALAYSKKHGIKVVLIDTAGRMYTKANLLKEMEKIIRISKPDLKIFVGESITGNDAIDQAKTFNEAIGIDGIILSKADIDEKAGTILSVSHITGKPIYFLGTGQNYEDLLPFTKKTVLKNLGLE